MTSLGIYKISAMWQPRIEPPNQIRDRFQCLIATLQKVHPLTAKWYHVNPEGACYDVDDLGDQLIDTIIGRVSKGEFGEPEPWMGYHLMAYNCRDVVKRPHGLWLGGTIGGQGQGMLRIATNYEITPDPHVISYDVFKAMLLAVAEAFEPDWVSAKPDDLEEPIYRDQYARPPMTIAWMINLSTPIAQLIDPPSTVISRRAADGSLFMAATDETFVTDNPKHMAGARAIHDVVDPLNHTVPFKTLIDWKDPLGPADSLECGP